MSARPLGRPWARLGLGIVSLCVLAVGCASPATAPEEKPAARPQLLIGLIPEHNLFKQLERYEPLARYLSGEIGADVRLKILSRYGNIIDNFAAAELDGAFFGSFTYALAHARLGVTVLARPVGLDGRSTYHGMILVRRDGGITGIEQLRGRRFAFVDKATTAGYLLPMEYFAEHGIEDYRTFCGETYFAGTHEDVVYDILDGKADAGAAKNTVVERLARSDRRVAEQLAVLAVSPEVPENGLALRRGIDPALREGMRRALLKMHESPGGREALRTLGAARFVETFEEDYAPVYRYARRVGLDLESYGYANDR